MVTVKWLKIHPDAKIPQFNYPGDAGADICTVEDIIIYPYETIAVSTGLKVVVPEGYEIQIRPRSGFSLKYPIRIANSPGTIDSNYRGEVKVILHNIGEEPYKFPKGAKIAQIVVKEIPKINHIEITEDEFLKYSTERGSKGFGSSGI